MLLGNTFPIQVPTFIWPTQPLASQGIEALRLSKTKVTAPAILGTPAIKANAIEDAMSAYSTKLQPSSQVTGIRNSARSARNSCRDNASLRKPRLQSYTK